MVRSISKKQQILKQVQSLVAEYGRQDEKLLVEGLLKAINPETEKKFTVSDIAKLLDITPQALHDRYPKILQEVKR